MLKSFYSKLSILFLVLLLGLGGVLTWLSIQALDGFVMETEQRLNRNLAQEMSAEFQEWVRDKIDRKMIEMEIQRISGYNPRIEIYLLDNKGKILASFPDEKLESATVDVTPLHRFLSGLENPPYLAEDPLRIGRMKPFSVAPITIMGQEGCFVYIILGGEQYDSIAGTIEESYIAQTLFYGLLISVASTGLVGLILFFFLTKRLRTMKETVRNFEQGQLDRRIHTTTSDEIGQLGTSFNQMADTIVVNMDELKRVDQLRRELIANVSHDLRSPLASIQGYLETITIKDADLSLEERRRYMEIALRNTETLNKLVGELFELSKLDAQQILPKKEAFSIAELVQDLVMQFQPQAEAAGVNLQAHLPERLSLVYADIALVERAITNLIDNAIRHTMRGGTVGIAPSNAAEHVDVQIIDTGVGIPPEDLPYIFDRFYRAEKSRTRGKQGGAGLGLAIARKILELHGSTLSVQSVLNQGTTFQFALPAWKAHQSLHLA
jgi:signal transduction histidine kinase